MSPVSNACGVSTVIVLVVASTSARASNTSCSGGFASYDGNRIGSTPAIWARRRTVADRIVHRDAGEEQPSWLANAVVSVLEVVFDSTVHVAADAEVRPGVGVRASKRPSGGDRQSEADLRAGDRGVGLRVRGRGVVGGDRQVAGDAARSVPGVRRAIVSFEVAVKAIAAGRLPSLFAPASDTVCVVYVPLAVTLMLFAPTM